jgi:hypothetical protein
MAKTSKTHFHQGAGAAMKRTIIALCVLIACLEGPAVGVERASERRGWTYNADYLFALSRALRDWDVSPAAKVPFLPVTLALDVGFLPFAVTAGLVGR